MRTDKTTYQQMYEDYKVQANRYQIKLNELKQKKREEYQKLQGNLYATPQSYEALQELEISIDRCRDILGDLNWGIRCLRDRYGVVIKL